MRFDWDVLKPQVEVSEISKNVIREIGSHFLSTQTGVPCHEKRVALGRDRGVIDTLIQQGLLRNISGKYYPTFPSLYYLDPTERDRCHDALDLVLGAFRELYKEFGARFFSMAEVLARINEMTSVRNGNATVQVGMLFARDFPTYFSLYQENPDLPTTAAHVIESVLDYENVQEAWREELCRRTASPQTDTMAATTTNKATDDKLPLLSTKQFEADLPELVADASATKPASLIFLDLDLFKKVNDSFDHIVGDEVLVRCATSLTNVCMGKGDCYRWGGEEFAVLLPNYTGPEALALAERIRLAIADTKFANYPNRMTASLGVATCPETSQNAEELLKDADKAMLAAKQAGRNQVRAKANSERHPLVRAAAAASSGQQSREARDKMRVEISRRIDAVELSVRILHGHAQNFTVLLENRSSEQLEVQEVRLETEQRQRLTNPYRPPQAPTVGPVATIGRRLEISWQASPNPAVELSRLLNVTDRVFLADVVVRTLCKLHGLPKWCRNTVRVQVDPSSAVMKQC